jgi:TPR repeat protein
LVEVLLLVALGDVSAMHNLATMYYNGDGIPQGWKEEI